MIRLRGGPADGCEVPRGFRVISVRFKDGKPAYRNGELQTATVPPTSADEQWVPYCWNVSSREYRWAQDPRAVPLWYDRLPRAH